MRATQVISFSHIDGAAELFTPAFVEYLLAMSLQFTPRVQQLRVARGEMLSKALKLGQLPGRLPPSLASTARWKVPALPEELKKPGIEISGPASVTGMFINAVNPGPDGARAEGDLDDDEDSAGHRFFDTVRAAHNRVGAVRHTLTYFDPEKKKEYRIQPGELPFFMHRERGLALDEPEVTFDSTRVPAAILGTALTLFHAGKAQAERGQGIYFYLPKLESVDEARFWCDFFDASRNHLPHLKDTAIRAIILVESLPAAHQMEEMLHALGPYGAGLNAARWDMQASILEYVMADPKQVWPDRFAVDIKSQDFLANMFRRLVAVCLKHGAVPIGGMATALPNPDDAVNQAAAAAIRADKEWEAKQGFVRGWTAHIFHMTTAAAPFKELRASGWKPAHEMSDPRNFPIELKVPAGAVTMEGTRRNVHTLVEYLEGWLNGRGAKAIDSLAGRPGVHPALMEDLATARISVAQTAQRVLHGAKAEDTGETHDFAAVKRLVAQETEEILDRLAARSAPDGQSQVSLVRAEERYRKAARIAMHWVKRYTEFDFRSLGSYTRAELDEIASGPDPF